MSIKFPIEFKLIELLDNYEKVINSVDSVVFDTNMLTPPIQFFRDDNSMDNETYLYKFIKEIDNNAIYYPVELFLKYNLFFFNQFQGLLFKYEDKVYIPKVTLSEIDKRIDFFYNSETYVRRIQEFNKDFTYNQKAVERFYKKVGTILTNIVTYSKTFSDAGDYSCTVDEVVVRAANTLLKEVDSVAIFSNDKDIVKISKLSRALNYQFDEKRMYVLGYRTTRKANSGELKVLVSYEYGKKVCSIDKFFK